MFYFKEYMSFQTSMAMLYKLNLNLDLAIILNYSHFLYLFYYFVCNIFSIGASYCEYMVLHQKKMPLYKFIAHPGFLFFKFCFL